MLFTGSGAFSEVTGGRPLAHRAYGPEETEERASLPDYPVIS
jgi:hypothetical protein